MERERIKKARIKKREGESRGDRSEDKANLKMASF